MDRNFSILGLLSIGMHAAMIVRPPLIMPAPPIPAIALPTMNIFDEIATPEMREPTSKRAKKDRNVFYNEIRGLYHRKPQYMDVP
jgi:hypothetical protein